jgi:Protein of unknown function (DUF3108)
MPPLRRTRWRWVAACTLAVLAAHALLFVALAPGWVDPEEAPHPTVALKVRSIVAAAPVAAVPEPEPAPAKVPAPVHAPKPRPAAPKAAVPEPVARAEAPAQESPEPSSPAVDLPVYATRLPQAGTWRYALQRGLASGEATLSWQPTADGAYDLHLEGRIAGLTVMDWASRGAIDGAGLAPERFAIRRRGRDHDAANFQRDAAKITFSGPTHEYPLLPGVQDRLSWMLQLSAIIDAAPQRFGPGARVTLMVIGARGGANLWSFNVVGTERVGDISALKLQRGARGPHDTQVEAWLDPAQGHLPLRLLLTQAEGGAPLELLRIANDKGSTAP